MNTANGQHWYRVADCNTVPVREGRCIQFRGREVALFNLGGEYMAVENRCPHRQGPLADGIVAGKSVFCPLHAWKICLETGRAQSGGEGAVRTYAVKVVGQEVYVALDDEKETSDDNV